MDISFYIIILTCLLALIELINKEPVKVKSKMSPIIKKLPKIGIFLLLIVLMSLNIFNTRKSIIRDANMENRSKLSLEEIQKTNANVKSANWLLDSIVVNIDDIIKKTQREILYFDSLNDNVKMIRKNIDINVQALYTINEKYKEQLNIEHEKILNEVPVVACSMPKSVVQDGLFHYTFNIGNKGVRMADSIIYHSLMIFVNPSNTLSRVDLYKTNLNNSGTLSLIGNSLEVYYANSPSIEINQIPDLNKAYLLIKYSYYDALTDSTFNNLLAFACASIFDWGGQYSTTVNINNYNSIKKYLNKVNPKYFNIFFGEKE